MNKYKVQFHAHTKSDPEDCLFHSDKALIDRAKSHNYDVLAITCHNKIAHTQELEAYAAEKGILLLPGMEKTVEKNHVVIVNAKKEAEKAESPGPAVSISKKTPYEEYYLMIRKEINDNARLQDVSGLEDEVGLQFTLDEEGFVIRGPVVLNKPDLKLVRAAVNCINKTSPFPHFPKGMKMTEAEFYVVVRYE